MSSMHRMTNTSSTRITRVTAVLNQKGGVGKTAITAGVAGALADAGRRVLAVDLDPQGHLTVSALQMPRVETEAPSLATVLAGDSTTKAADLPKRHSTTEAGGVLDVLPTSLRMWTAVRDLDKRPDRERQLGRLLGDLAATERYDHVLIDCPPALDVLADNALAAADGILIPAQPDDTSVEALRILLAQLAALERGLNRAPLDRHGLVASCYRTPLSLVHRTTMEALAALDGLPILAHCPLSVVVPEAWRKGEPVTRYAPDHQVSEAYRSLADMLEGARP